MKLLLNTNVLADFYLQREQFSAHVNSIAAAAIHRDVELWASAKSYTDIFYISKKYFASDVLQKAFLESFKFIHVCSLDSEDLKSAAKECWSDFEDCLIYRCALKTNANFIVTRDIRGFVKSTIKTATPEEMVEMFAEAGFYYEIINV